MTWRTLAKCFVIPAFATGPWSTSDCLADFDTNAVESVANFVGRTVIVTLAADWHADDGGIALQSGRAVALRSMESDTTEGVRTALIAAEDARIKTFSGDTGSIGWTIVIHNTFSCSKIDK